MSNQVEVVLRDYRDGHMTFAEFRHALRDYLVIDVGGPRESIDFKHQLRAQVAIAPQHVSSMLRRYLQGEVSGTSCLCGPRWLI
jgi:hypothetical protein